MSDTFEVEITSIQGTTVTCRCLTGTAGDPNDLSASRSFAVLLLYEALYRQDRAPKHPLAVEMNALGEPFDEAFFRKHADRFVAATRVLWRDYVCTEPDAWARGRNARYDELVSVENPDYDQLDRILDDEFPRHRYELEIRVSDPKYLDGFRVGMTFGTTSYDAWPDDPGSAALDDIPVRDGRWSPPPTGLPTPKRAATKSSPRTKSIATKRGAKRAAGKKKGAAKSGTPKSRAPKSGTAKSGTAKSGTAKSRAPKSRAPKSSTAKSRTAKSGTAKSRAPKSGAAKSGEKSGPKRAKRSTRP